MKLTDGRITFLVNEKGATIELYDYAASTTFAKVKLTSEQFTKALSRFAYTECQIDVYNLGDVGTTMEHKKLEFEMPADVSYAEQLEVAKRIAEEKCPEGWSPDLYFGSRDSFFRKEGVGYARTTIRRWVVKKSMRATV